MKVVIVSDIHGSLTALEQIVEAEKKWDLMVCLGDHLYHGPRNPIPQGYNPLGVATFLNALDNVVLVKGNVDAPIDEELIKWPMSSLVHLYIDGFHWLAHHGHLPNIAELYRAQVILSGHTHIKRLELTQTGVIVNPGSPSLPKDGMPSYACLSGGVLYLRNLSGLDLVSIDLATLGGF